MLSALLAVVIIFAILVVSEVVWKRVKVHPELARKFVHISAGTFVAFLPFWVSWGWVQLLAIGFTGVNLANHKLHIFHAIGAVRRQSWGDVLFGVGVLVVALFEPDQWIFAMSMLQVSLADGFAAVAGVTYGNKRGKYYLFTQPKSIIGSSAFVLMSFSVFALGITFSGYFVSTVEMLPLIVILPLLLVCVENLSVFGWDNITLPLITMGILSLF